MLSEQNRQILERARARVVSRDNPLLVDLPAWVQEYRPQQVDTIQQIVSAFDRVPVVVLDAPTGSGKTLIAETVRRLLDTSCNYVCSSKSLQRQFMEDFPYGQLIQGRGNYPTELYPDRFRLDGEWRDNLSCAECTGEGCQWCADSCPYLLAKELARKSPLAVLNTSYFLYECNQRHSKFTGRGLVVLDEADTLEKEVMGYVSIDISARRVRELRLGLPEKITVQTAWEEWVGQAIPKVIQARANIRGNSQNVMVIREKKYLDSLIQKLRVLSEQLPDGYWVYTGRDDTVAFKPVHVSALGERALWSHGRKFLLMSGTVISPAELLSSLGYRGRYETVFMECAFPRENRKVIAVPRANMSKGVNDRDGLGRELLKVVSRHGDDESILLHTVSYDLAGYCRDVLATKLPNRTVLSYTQAGQREDVLTRFKQSRGSILVASSMDRGIDLPGDLCRVQVICKVPFPYLGDRQISARLHSKGGQSWYAVQTVRTIMQMTGRAVRSMDDFAVTYILDSQFKTNVWDRSMRLFPKWWREAVEWQT